MLLIYSDICSHDSDGSAYDAVSFWLHVKSMKTVLGDKKYQHLSTLALHLLTVPASNADCERVFSLVRRIITDLEHVYFQRLFLL